MMCITHSIGRAHHEKHMIRGRWTSTDADDSEGDMLLQLPLCECVDPATLNSARRSPDFHAGNGGVT